MTSLDYYYKFRSVYRIEILKEFLDEINQLESEDDAIKDLIEEKIESENNDLKKLDSKKDKKKKFKEPRKLSGYNIFVKEQLPIIKVEFPELENKQRMSKASELWKNLTENEKEKYKSVNKEDSLKKETIEVLDEEEVVTPVVKKVSKKSKK